MTCGPFPDGLDGIRALAPRNREYVTGLFRSLFFGQAKQTGTAERIWNGIGRGAIDCVRDMGGQPYFVIGDSHTHHYLRRKSSGEKWLAALPLMCVGAVAMRLAADDSGPGYGRRILDWARNNAAFGQPSDVPVFLKFGGIDAEAHWVRTRIRKGTYRFSIEEFSDFAQEAVSCYGRFLDALTEVMDRGCLRICAAYPAVIDDAHWVEVYVGMHRAADRAFIAGELMKMDIPDRSTRTRLRRLFNEYLQEMCRAKSLVFVDDFSPFLDRSGETDERCYARYRGRNFHISYAESEERMIKLIEAELSRASAHSN